MPRLLFAIVLVGCSDPASQPTPDGAPRDAVTADADAPACEEGATRPCGSDVGACELGVETCAGGAWGACTGGVAPAAMETCDGASDDDCDGEIDDGCPTDPFDPASCGGAPLTPADAVALLGGEARRELAAATIQVRTRTCSGSVCDPWSAGTAWQTRFLTYSGGVTTRYQNVQADTKLVLFADEGVAQLSIQHVTFPAGGYSDDMGMVFAVPPAPVMYPVFRAYNVAPQYQYDYRDLELTLKDGALVVGAHCARFTATVFGASPPYTTEYAALYRW